MRGEHKAFSDDGRARYLVALEDGGPVYVDVVDVTVAAPAGALPLSDAARRAWAELMGDE